MTVMKPWRSRHFFFRQYAENTSCANSNYYPHKYGLTYLNFNEHVPIRRDGARRLNSVCIKNRSRLLRLDNRWDRLPSIWPQSR